MSDQPLHAGAPVHTHKGHVKRLDGTRNDLEGLGVQSLHEGLVVPSPSHSFHRTDCIHAGAHAESVREARDEG
jgi:hypothetical protein